MCGRYTLIPNKDFYNQFNVENHVDNLRSLYNIAPGQTTPVITHNSPNKVVLMRWGLIPFWAEDSKIGYKTINAKAETVASKPAFRASFKGKRCLVPASGFYEWKVVGPKKKQPYYFYLNNQEMFAFAGLYDIWKNEKGEDLKTYTIITTQANNLVNQVHERMPVILDKKSETVWLDKETDLKNLQDLLKPYVENEISCHSVSSLINDTKLNDESLIKVL